MAENRHRTVLQIEADTRAAERRLDRLQQKLDRVQASAVGAGAGQGAGPGDQTTVGGASAAMNNRMMLVLDKLNATLDKVDSTLNRLSGGGGGGGGGTGGGGGGGLFGGGMGGARPGAGGRAIQALSGAAAGFAMTAAGGARDPGLPAQLMANVYQGLGQLGSNVPGVGALLAGGAGLQAARMQIGAMAIREAFATAQEKGAIQRQLGLAMGLGGANTAAMQEIFPFSQGNRAVQRSVIGSESFSAMFGAELPTGIRRRFFGGGLDPNTGEIARLSRATPAGTPRENFERNFGQQLLAAAGAYGIQPSEIGSAVSQLVGAVGRDPTRFGGMGLDVLGSISRTEVMRPDGTPTGLFNNTVGPSAFLGMLRAGIPASAIGGYLSALQFGSASGMGTFQGSQFGLRGPIMNPFFSAGIANREGLNPQGITAFLGAMGGAARTSAQGGMLPSFSGMETAALRLQEAFGAGNAGMFIPQVIGGVMQMNMANRQQIGGPFAGFAQSALMASALTQAGPGGGMLGVMGAMQNMQRDPSAMINAIRNMAGGDTDLAATVFASAFNIPVDLAQALAAGGLPGGAMAGAEGQVMGGALDAFLGDVNRLPGQTMNELLARERASGMQLVGPKEMEGVVQTMQSMRVSMQRISDKFMETGDTIVNAVEQAMLRLF